MNHQPSRTRMAATPASRQMIGSHPLAQQGADSGALAHCIQTCFDCADACAICADTCRAAML